MSKNLGGQNLALGLEEIVYVPVPKKGDLGWCENLRTISLISYASKVSLKIIQERLEGFLNKWRQH